jgi:short-subunit dehydrogenase
MADRFAVVTGASSGIGLELAKQFAEHGFDVLVAAEDAGISDAASALRGYGVEARAVQVDLARYEGVEELAAHIDRPIDAIALNAGVGVGGDFRETDLDAELRLIRLNVDSVVHLTKRVLPSMTARGEGRLLYTASIASTMPAPFEAVYGASKAFVLSFAEAIRNEVKDTGVTVTALMPGPTETEFFARADMLDTKVGADDSKDDPALVARQGFEALMKGDDAVVAGTLSTRLQGRINELLPETVKAAMHRRMSEPGSAGGE